MFRKIVILRLTLPAGILFADVAPNIIPKDQLDPPMVGESRPVWWYKIWNRKSVVLLGKLHRNPHQADDKINYEVTEGGKKTLMRLSKISFSVIDPLFVSIGDDILSSEAFEKGDNIEIYLPEKFNTVSQRWVGQSIKEGEEVIVFLDDVGVIKPGSYYVVGLLEPTYLDSVREAIKRRKNTRP